MPAKQLMIEFANLTAASYGSSLPPKKTYELKSCFEANESGQIFEQYSYICIRKFWGKGGDNIQMAIEWNRVNDGFRIPFKLPKDFPTNPTPKFPQSWRLVKYIIKSTQI